MTKKIHFFLFFFLTFFQNTITSGQGTALSKQDFQDFSLLNSGLENSKTIFSLLNQSDLLKVTIETDLDYLIENKNKDEYQGAKLTFKSNNGLEQHDVKIKPRGRFRRKNCDFPPLKIKFNKSELKERGISTSHKSLKLVTHCMDEGTAEQTLLKEYIAYKLYNNLTKSSFNVQLVQITYVNSAKDTLDNVKYGFIIENTDEMAERIGGVEVEDCYNITLDSISKRYRHLIPMFQYMISNMDWRPEMLQNVKVVEVDNGERIIVPYDFDFSGLVNAPYAIPNIDYQQANIQDRIYMNKVDDIAELKSTIRFFQIHKAEMIQIIKECELLSKKNRRKMVNYIQDFYRTLDSKVLSTEAFVK